MKKIVRQLRHGQITIPKELREALGLEDDDLLAITFTSGKLEIEPVRVAPKSRGSPWAAELYELSRRCARAWRATGRKRSTKRSKRR
jgi:AbrB family looped-hinge helix DNA binding protein